MEGSICSPVTSFHGRPPILDSRRAWRVARIVKGPLDFTLFQKLDHGAIVTALGGRHCGATTYVFDNALIAVEMTRHVPRGGLYVPLACSSRRSTATACASRTTCPRPSWSNLDRQR